MGTLTNIGACQEQGGIYYELGTNADTNTITGTDSGQAQFLMIASDAVRAAQVTCTCDTSKRYDMTYQGEIGGGPITYAFALTSRYCCPGHHSDAV